MFACLFLYKESNFLHNTSIRNSSKCFGGGSYYHSYTSTNLYNYHWHKYINEDFWKYLKWPVKSMLKTQIHDLIFNNSELQQQPVILVSIIEYLETEERFGLRCILTGTYFTVICVNSFLVWYDLDIKDGKKKCGRNQFRKDESNLTGQDTNEIQDK